MKTSLSVTIKVEVVCEVGPRRALRDKLRWYMAHGDSIKTLDLRHLGKWRSLMLGSCDIYKIKLFLNIWSYITCFFLCLFFNLFFPANAWILNNGSRVEDDRFSRYRGRGAAVFVCMCLGLVRGTGWCSVFDKCTISDLQRSIRGTICSW